MTTLSKKLPKGPKTLAIRQTLKWIFQPYKYLDELASVFGDVFTLRLMGRGDFIFFTHPQAIREIFTGSSDDLYAGEGNAILEPILGNNSLLLLDGERHLQERRILLPPFRGERMRLYGTIIQQITQETTQRWQSQDEFIVQDTMQEISLDVILQAVFGIGKGERFQKAKKLIQKMIAFSDSKNSLALFLPFLQKDLGPLTPWKSFIKVMASIDQFIFGELKTRRQENIEGEDILSMLLQAKNEDGSEMSDQQLRDELMTMLLAGHETTATALAWAFYWIHKDPEILQKLLDELQGLENIKEITQCKYLDAICKETLRLYPVVPVVARKLQKPMTIAGHHLPAGVRAIPCIYLTHHREDLYPNSKQFRPERFLERQYSPYEFLPFGGGVRRCIGAAFAMYEMKIVLATVLKNFRLQLQETQPVLSARRGITLGPKGGVRMALSR